MFDNPLIERYRYSALRPRQLWIYVTIYISVILLIILLNYAGYQYRAFFEDIVECNKSLYYQFLTFEAIVLFIWSAYNSGSAIREEMLNKSYDFFRLLPLPAHKKATGILIGKNLLVFLFGAINLVFLTYFGLAGGINIKLQGQILLLLISITILSNLTCLLSSINPAKRSKGPGIALAFLAAFFLISMIGNAIAMSSSVKELENVRVYFFKIRFPVLLLIFFITLYFSIWELTGILRRFTREQEPLFTRKGVLLFLVGYIFVVAGLYYTHISKEDTGLIYSYWLVTLIPLLIIPWGSLRRFDSYIEFSRAFQTKPGSRKQGVFSVLVFSNLLLEIALFAIWAVFSISAFIFAGNSYTVLLENLYNIFILFTCYLFFALLLELYVIYLSAYGKIGLLLGFVALLYAFLPLLLSAIFHNQIFYHYSPVGFFASLFNRFPTDFDQALVKSSFWQINIAICILPAVLVWKRYKFILTQRREM
jgi:hypothetical protein